MADGARGVRIAESHMTREKKLYFKSAEYFTETYGSESGLYLLCSDRKAIRLASHLSTHFGVSEVPVGSRAFRSLGTDIDV